MRHLESNGTQQRDAVMVPAPDGLTIQVMPDPEHGFWITNKQVAIGFGCHVTTVRASKTRHLDELIEGTHWGMLQIATPFGTQDTIVWSRAGVIKMGMFLKTKRAKLFREWAANYLAQQMEQPQAVALPAPARDPYADLLGMIATLDVSAKRRSRMVQLATTLAGKGGHNG